MPSNKEFTSQLLRCLREAFPDADLSPGSYVWTKVVNPMAEFAGPSPLGLQARQFIQAVLRTKHPTLERDKDGVTDDTMIKPVESILAPVVQELSVVKSRQTLRDLRVHTLDSIGDLASNFGVVRGEGAYARGVVRLYYNAPVNERVTPETWFETNSGLRFFATTVQSITSSQMSLNLYGSLYYWDVRVVAEKPGTAFNTEPGTLVRAPTLSRVVRCTNTLRYSGGLSRDSVEDVAAELENYPCTRQIGTRRGSVAKILADLGAVRVVEVVGMGDPDMKRDIIRGGEVESEVATYPTAGTSASGRAGTSLVDAEAGFVTRRFRDNNTPANFTDLFGFASGEVTEGWYLLAAWADGASTRWAIERVERVIDQFTLELASRALPIQTTGIHWALCRARLTLSEIPGGVLWPDTPDGEVVIRDDEIHVGSCTDVYLMGTSVENATVDIEALTDEELAGSGDLAQTVPGGVFDSRWIILDDAERTIVLGPAYATLLGPGTGVYQFWTHAWGGAGGLLPVPVALQAGQVLYAPAPASQRFRVLVVRAMTDGTSRLEVELDGDTGVDIAGATIFRRRPGTDMSNACLHVRSGGAAGYYRALFDVEGGQADAAYAGIAGCRYRVWVAEPPTVADTNKSWALCDDIDMDLADPKILRVAGTTLVTTGGSDVVFDPGPVGSPMDFTLYGVQEGDILRIDAGVDAGDYVVRFDPFGAGSAFLRISAILHSSTSVRYRIFRPSPPVNLPLLSFSEVQLLDADGSPIGLGSAGGVDLGVPYGEPLGAYSSTFTNLARGEKCRTSQAVTGIRTVTGIELGIAGPIQDFTLASGTPCRFWLWHRDLSWRPWSEWTTGGWISDGDGGYLVPLERTHTANGGSGPYALHNAGVWDVMLDEVLNCGLPYPFWGYEDEVVGGSTFRYLVCRPFGAFFMALGTTSDWWMGGAPSPLNFGDYIAWGDSLDLPLNPGVYNRIISSRDIYSADLTATLTPGGLASVTSGQDQACIMAGVNAGVCDVVGYISYIYRQRLRLDSYAALAPEGNVRIVIGAPSTGRGRVYFKDPTDCTLDGATRFTSDEDETLVYWPDPAMFHPVLPAYPETVKPDNAWTTAGVPLNTILYTFPARDFLGSGVRPGDWVEISYRDIVTTRDGAGGGLWPVGPLGGDETLVLTVDDIQPVTVTFTAGSTYTADTAAALINQTFGQTIAVAVMNVVHLRWQSALTVSGTALVGAPATGVLGEGTPPTNNRAYGYGIWRIGAIDDLLSGGTDGALQLEGDAAAADLGGCNLQYRVLRKGVQRITAVEMAESDGPGGLYYADVELVSYGVGDRFNIEAQQKLNVTGARARGWRMSCTNENTSFSLREEPWLHLDCYFQPATASADLPENDQAVYGSGTRLHYDRSALVSSAQALLNSRDERDNNQQVLARHLFPYYVGCDVSYAGGALESVVLPKVQDLLLGRDPNEPLDVSDILGVITSLNSDHVDMPIELAVLRHRPDRSLDVLVGTDRIEVPRLAGFLPGRITLTRRS